MASLEGAKPACQLGFCQWTCVHPDHDASSLATTAASVGPATRVATQGSGLPQAERCTDDRPRRQRQPSLRSLHPSTGDIKAPRAKDHAIQWQPETSNAVDRLHHTHGVTAADRSRDQGLFLLVMYGIRAIRFTASTKGREEATSGVY